MEGEGAVAKNEERKMKLKWLRKKNECKYVCEGGSEEQEKAYKYENFG